MKRRPRRTPPARTSSRPSVTFVIMAGGKGERLWPLVDATTPKACLCPTGNRTLLQMTIDRLRPVWPGAQWLIVTTKEQAAAIRASVPAALRRAVLVEPEGKNTAACLTLAAAVVATRDPQRVMVVVPADHWIRNASAFRQAIRRAIHAAVTHDTVATIGIRPTYPHPGLGYLCARPLLNRTARRPRVYRLIRFVEKPSRAEAQRLLKRPLTYWNSGMFVATADRFLEYVSEWLPDHAKRLVPVAMAANHRRAGWNPERFVRQASRSYRKLEQISFDHGVMCHVRDGIVVVGNFRWADLGSWDAWVRLGTSASRTIRVNSQRVSVVSRVPHLVAAIGVRDLLVVHSPSATLICRPDQAQTVQDVARRIASDPRYAAFR